VRIQRKPFHSRLGVESVKLELEVMGSIGTTLLVVSPIGDANTHFNKTAYVSDAYK